MISLYGFTKHKHIHNIKNSFSIIAENSAKKKQFFKLNLINKHEELIKNPQLGKNTLVTMSNFDVINSKLDKIIKKVEEPEIQLVKASNQQQAQNPHVKST